VRNGRRARTLPGSSSRPFVHDPQEIPMNFIVKPVQQPKGDINYTMCVLCSENPKWCA
jgi:hypothetical protein